MDKYAGLREIVARALTADGEATGGVVVPIADLSALLAELDFLSARQQELTESNCRYVDDARRFEAARDAANARVVDLSEELNQTCRMVANDNWQAIKIGELRARAATLLAERDALREALTSMVSWAIPGMNWTDEIGEALLEQARAALVSGEGEHE